MRGPLCAGVAVVPLAHRGRRRVFGRSWLTERFSLSFLCFEGFDCRTVGRCIPGYRREQVGDVLGVLLNLPFIFASWPRWDESLRAGQGR